MGAGGTIWLDDVSVDTTFNSNFTADKPQEVIMEFDVTYTEPTTNVDGAELNDLKETQVFYSVDGALPVAATPTPASTSSGGEVITKSIIVELTPGMAHTVSAFVRAIDTSGNISHDSSTDTVTVDFLAPGAPQGVSIRRAK